MVPELVIVPLMLVVPLSSIEYAPELVAFVRFTVCPVTLWMTPVPAVASVPPVMETPR